MEQLRFSIPEIVSLIGIVQCVYILVYMLFRSGRLSHAGLPFLYFLVLGTAFFLDLGKAYIGELTEYYDVMRWVAWYSGPPLSVLLVVQIAQITRLPALRHFWVLVLIPLALGFSSFMSSLDSECKIVHQCGVFYDWLIVSGLIAGALSLLAIWMKRGLFEGILIQKTGKERYWLILALVFANIFFLGAMLLSLSSAVSEQDAVLIRTILGLGLVYLTSTSLFRIYPQAVRLIDKADKGDSLSNEELELAMKVERLMELDKVYHETGYSRTDLARELGASEAVISKVINLHFDKSFPQLVSEHRVEDAKRLLVETDASIKVIAEEVGFNSLASFNRVFKELTGNAPSAYRKSQVKAA